ncbi:MAG: hypothetical protein NZ805_00910 [Armatimonadetes bacterium]|nr:hypothetical protein [Armatimonadota bacterium]MDW8027647.1 hypothetical protein [Armatimonadota bacterium]
MPRSIEPTAFDTSSLPRSASLSEPPTDFLPSPAYLPKDESSKSDFKGSNA